MTATTTTMLGMGRGDDGSDEDDGSFNPNGYGGDGMVEPKPVRVKFVRCPLCRKEKKMCEPCRKRQNREASQRHRQKHWRNEEALEHLKATIRTLKAQHCDDRKLIEQLTMGGARPDNPQQATVSKRVLQAASPVSYGTNTALAGSTSAHASGSCDTAPALQHPGLGASGYRSPDAHKTSPDAPLPNCEQLYDTCGNTVPFPGTSLEDQQASYHRSLLLLPPDLVDFEPTLAELNLSDDWDALYMDTSMQGSQYGDKH